MKQQILRLRTGAGDRDRDVAFALPAEWDLSMHAHAGAAALTDTDIRRAFARPVGMGPIREQARGMRSAVILVDDFRRPTPAETLSLAVIAELHQAGLRKEQITIVLGGGAHRTMNDREIRRRLGRAADAVGQVLAHDAFSDDVVFLGITRAGTPVLVNRIAAQADFSVSISTVYPHALTAWGGGAKMVLPGITHVATSTYHHTRLAAGTWGGNPSQAPARLDLEEAAAIFGLDVSVCAVINADKALCGLRVGAPTAAHRSAIRIARKVYHTDKRGLQPDLVIANAYPMDADPTQLSKAEIPARRYGAPVLIITDFADPCPWHGVYHGPRQRYLRHTPSAPPQRSPELLRSAPVFLYSARSGRFPLTSNQTWYCEDNWDRLVAALQERLPPKAKVCVLPSAPLQMPV